MAIKPGDTVFFHCGGDVTLMCSVASIGDKAMEFEVINGGYMLHVEKADPPIGDYNAAMDWFSRTRLGKKS